jgi:hypothetical protein
MRFILKRFRFDLIDKFGVALVLLPALCRLHDYRIAQLIFVFDLELKSLEIYGLTVYNPTHILNTLNHGRSICVLEQAQTQRHEYCHHHEFQDHYGTTTNFVPSSHQSPLINDTSKTTPVPFVERQAMEDIFGKKVFVQHRILFGQQCVRRVEQHGCFTFNFFGQAVERFGKEVCTNIVGQIKFKEAFTNIDKATLAVHVATKGQFLLF